MLPGPTNNKLLPCKKSPPSSGLCFTRGVFKFHPKLQTCSLRSQFPLTILRVSRLSKLLQSCPTWGMGGPGPEDNRRTTSRKLEELLGPDSFRGSSRFWVGGQAAEIMSDVGDGRGGPPGTCPETSGKPAGTLCETFGKDSGKIQKDSTFHVT